MKIKFKSVISTVFNYVIFIVFFISFLYIYLENEKIGRYYIQKKENYTSLKELHQKTIEFYNIKIEQNDELNNLSHLVDYQENFIKEPDSIISENYNYIFGALVFTGMFLFYYFKKIKNQLAKYLECK